MKQQGPHGIEIERHASEVAEVHNSGINTTEYRCQSLKSKIRTAMMGHYKRQLPTKPLLMNSPFYHPERTTTATKPTNQSCSKNETSSPAPTAMTFNFLSMRSTVTCHSQCHGLLRHSIMFISSHHKHPYSVKEDQVLVGSIPSGQTKHRGKNS